MVKNTKKKQKKEELDYANNIAALISLYEQQANGFSRGSSQKSAKVESSFSNVTREPNSPLQDLAHGVTSQVVRGPLLLHPFSQLG